MKRLVAHLVAVMAMALAACATDPVPLEEPDLSEPPGTSIVPGTTLTPEDTVVTPPGADPDLAPVALAARADLASRLGVSEEDIEVTSWAVVIWNDGSIGCPEEGMAYTQALVEGARVTLEHDGVEYAYHEAGDGEVFLCEDPAEGSYTVSTGNEGLEPTPPPGYDE